MEQSKKILMICSFISIAIGFGASIWLYTVLHDTMSIVLMVVFFLALVWYGFNLRNMLKSK